MSRRQAQPAKTGWIPCSKRLPEDDRYVLITGVWRGNKYIKIAWNERGRWRKGLSSADFINNDEVVAWMPLPEPWEEEDEK